MLYKYVVVFILLACGPSAVFKSIPQREREVYINTEEKANSIPHSGKVLQGEETRTAKKPWC